MPIHFETHCAACGSPMLLPSDTLQQPFSYPETQPNNSLCVGIVCHQCKSAERYFLHQKHPQHNPKDQAWAMDSRIEDTVLVSILACDVEACSFRQPLFAQWSPPTTEEE